MLPTSHPDDDPNHPDNLHCPFKGLGLPKSATEEQIIAACDYKIENVQPLADILDKYKSEVFSYTTSKDRFIRCLEGMRDEAIDIIRSRKAAVVAQAAEKKRAEEELLEKDKLHRAMIAGHVEEDLKPIILGASGDMEFGNFSSAKTSSAQSLSPNLISPALSLCSFFRSELSKISPPEDDTRVMLQAYFPLTQRLKRDLEESRLVAASEQAARKTAEDRIARLESDLSIMKRMYDGEIGVVRHDLHFERTRVMFAEGRYDEIKQKTAESVESFEAQTKRLELTVQVLYEAGVKAEAAIQTLKIRCEAEREEKEYTEDMNDYLKTQLESLKKRHATAFAELQQQKEGIASEQSASEQQESTSDTVTSKKRNSEEMEQSQIIEVKSEQQEINTDGSMNSSSKKRKHDKIFSDANEEEQYKKTIENFVKNNLTLCTDDDSNAFISTTDLTIAFEKSQKGKTVEMGIKFLKELKQQIMLSFGKAVVSTRITTQQGKVSGYAGVVFKGAQT